MDQDQDQSVPILTIEESNNNDEEFLIPQKFTVYKRRWFILFIFSLNTMMSAILFFALSSVNNIVVNYYQTSPVNIEWLTNMFMIFYVIFSIPSSYCISRWGVRPVITVASLLNLVSTLVHYPGYKRGKFMLILFGQVFSALGHSAMYQIPGKISVLWFPETERATATCIGVLMNVFGAAVGFAHPASMIKSGDAALVEKELKMFFISQIVMSAIIFIVTLGYKEKPPSPPSEAVERENVDIVESIRSLWKNKYFIYLSQSYGIYSGLFVVIGALLNSFITSRFHKENQSQIGWMAFWSNILAMISLVAVGRLLDKFRRYQLTAVLLNLSSMVFWLIFILLLSFSGNFKAVFGVYLCLGVFFVPYFAGGIEQVAEMTYPVPEEVSSSVIYIFANLYGFLGLYTLGVASQHGYTMPVGYVIVGLYFISTLLSCFAKTDLKRLNANSADR